MEYYSAIKKNELLIHTATQTDFKITRLSEKIQQRGVYTLRFHSRNILGNVNYVIMTGRRSVVAWGWGKAAWGWGKVGKR